MRNDVRCLGTTAMLLLCSGQWAEGQDLQKSRPMKNYPPRSLYDVFGVYANTAPDMEWQSRFATAAPTVSVALPLISSNSTTPVAGGPPGTQEMLVYRNAPTSHCVTAALYPAFATVFDYTFTTGPGSKYLQINYTAQANINDVAGVVDGPAFQCLVSQTTAGVTTIVPCSNTELLPYLLARTIDGRGGSVVTTYSGYVAVDPSTVTRVQIQVAAAVSSTVAKVCGNNLTLRY